MIASYQDRPLMRKNGLPKPPFSGPSIWGGRVANHVTLCSFYIEALPDRS
jgi:hypothetical protein